MTSRLAYEAPALRLLDKGALILPESIPDALKAYPQWVCWRYKWNEKREKWEKPPFDPKTGRYRDGDVEDLATCTTFEQALTAFEQSQGTALHYNGIGFALTSRDPFVGIDFDHCIRADNSIEAWAQQHLDEFASYAEYSPSDGLHVLTTIDGRLPHNGKRGNIEMYDCGRYFTVTGRHVAGMPATIEQRTEAVLRLNATVFAPKESKSESASGGEYTNTPGGETFNGSQIDDDTYQRALTWLNHFVEYNPNTKLNAAKTKLDDSTYFQFLVQTTFSRWGRDVTWALRDDINACCGYKYDGRVDKAMRDSFDYLPKDLEEGRGGRTAEEWRDKAKERSGNKDSKQERSGDKSGEKEGSAKQAFKRASEFEVETVEWLWENRIPVGKYTVLVGDPDMGKSMLATDIVARITRGRRLPTGVFHLGHATEATEEPPRKGGVVLIAPEDGVNDTIVPRLIAANADLPQVIILNSIKDGEDCERLITLPNDVDIIRDAIEDVDACAIVIDPISTVLGGKTDSYKDPDVRRALTPLIQLANEKHCSIIGIMHLNKGNAKSNNALYRSLGSIAFVALARTGLFVVPDPDDDNVRVLVNHKNNLKKKPVALRYTIEENEQKQPYIKWLGASKYSNAVLLQPREAPTQVPSAKAQDIVSVLKASDEALTVKEIADKLGKSEDEREHNTLQRMLNRKVAQGVLWKPARNMYTYVGNPKYEKLHNGGETKGKSA